MIFENIFIGLGSNIGKREAYINSAIKEIRSIQKTDIIHISSIIETKPIGNVLQPNFLNAVVRINSELEPIRLLNRLQVIEQKLGRHRTEKWSPRTIDLDILFYDELILSSDELTIPHPEIMNRSFILQLMNEIASEYTHPLQKKTMKELYE